MISLVLDQKDPYAFENLAKTLTPMIRRAVLPFTRDRMLARTEDADSLTNLCLWKLHQAQHDFKYEDDYTEEHNQRRFVALVKRYITNILIDQQYSANLKIRKPEGGLVSTAQLTGEDDDGEYEPLDRRQHTSHQVAVAQERREHLLQSLDPEALEVADLLLDGYTAEGIARKLGMQTSRVRYFIYNSIQPRTLEYV